MDTWEFPRELQIRHEKVLLNSEKEEYLKLYEYWENIPAVRSLHDVEEWIYDDKTIRLAILRILSNGYTEQKNGSLQEYGIDQLTRHCFHPKELQFSVNTVTDENVKLPNLYFHLEVLQKYGLIKPVCVLSDGRYDITYFGRTAKLFLFRTSNNEFDQVLEDKDALINDLHQFSEILDLKYTKEETSEVIAEFMDQRRRYEQTILSLMESIGDEMHENDVDPSRIFVLLTHIFTTDKLEKLRDLVFEKAS